MKYTVKFEAYAERHYVKKFSKKYKTAWDRTYRVLQLEFAFINNLFQKTIAEEIAASEDGDVRICKTEFKVVGTSVSPHKSGNRCIVAVHNKDSKVRVLLVYHKSDILKSGNETVAWKKIVRKEFPEYCDLLSL